MLGLSAGKHKTSMEHCKSYPSLVPQNNLFSNMIQEINPQIQPKRYIPRLLRNYNYIICSS